MNPHFRTILTLFTAGTVTVLTVWPQSARAFGFDFSKQPTCPEGWTKHKLPSGEDGRDKLSDWSIVRGRKRIPKQREFIDYAWERAETASIVQGNCDMALSAGVSFTLERSHAFNVGFNINLVKEWLELTGGYEYTISYSTGSEGSINVGPTDGYEYLAIPVVLSVSHGTQFYDSPQDVEVETKLYQRGGIMFCTRRCDLKVLKREEEEHDFLLTIARVANFSRPTFMGIDKNYNEMEEWKAFRSRRIDSPYANIAALPLAQCLYRMGHKESEKVALALFSEYLVSVPLGHPSHPELGKDFPPAAAQERVEALVGQGYVYEAQRMYDQALASFEQASREVGGKRIGEYHRARIFILQGKKFEAAAILDRLSKVGTGKASQWESAPKKNFSNAFRKVTGNYSDLDADILAGELKPLLAKGNSAKCGCDSYCRAACVSLSIRNSECLSVCPEMCREKKFCG